MIPFSAIDAISSEEITHHLSGLVRIGVDLVDWDHASDGCTGRGGKCLDVVLIVAHLHGARKSSPRHGL